MVTLGKDASILSFYCAYMRGSHGGLSAVMKLTKMFAENGAAAIHFEDQLHGGKKVLGESLLSCFAAGLIEPL